jgi:polyhydroxyalkanoate synthase
MHGSSAGLSTRLPFRANWSISSSSGSIARIFFCQSALKIDGTLVGPQSVSVPTLAVINTVDDVALLSSVKPFMDAMPTRDARIIEYPGEVGVCLQHLGILIGRQAHAQVWPDITSWIDLHR